MSVRTGTVPPSHFRVFVEILLMASRGERVLFRSLRKRLGWHSLNYIHTVLHALRDAGLVSFEDRASCTVRPTCRLELFEEAMP